MRIVIQEVWWKGSFHKLNKVRRDTDFQHGKSPDYPQNLVYIPFNLYPPSKPWSPYFNIQKSKKTGNFLSHRSNVHHTIRIEKTGNATKFPSIA